MAPSLCREVDTSNLTCLSLAVAYGAPLDILQLIHDTDPSLVSKKDMYGATALHVGCLNGASPEAIRFLIERRLTMRNMMGNVMGNVMGEDSGDCGDCGDCDVDFDLVTELDFDDRSPMHHAVECACSKVADYAEQMMDDYEEEMDNGSSGRSRNGKSKGNGNRGRNGNGKKATTPRPKDFSFLKPVVDVINELCRAAPEMVNVQDNSSGTPIDLIQISKNNYNATSEEYVQLDRIYQLLNQTSIQFYLKKKKQWEMERVATVAVKSECNQTETATKMMSVLEGESEGVPERRRVGEGGSISSGSRSSFSSIKTPHSGGGYSGDSSGVYGDKQSCLMNLSVLQEE